MQNKKSIFSAFLSFFGAINAKSWLPSDDRWYSSALSRGTASGSNVDNFNSLQSSAVFCAINLLAGTIGTLPLFLYKKSKDGKERAVNHPLYDVMHTKPNEFMTSTGMREAMAGHLVSWGNCFAEKRFDSMGRLVGLFPIPPDRIRIEISNGYPYYIINIDSKEYKFDRDQILHIPGMGFDGFQGYSLLTLARESIGLTKATEEFGSRFFGSGTHPAAILTHPAKLSTQAHERLSESFKSLHSGLGNSHKTIILEEGMDLAKVGIPPNDAQFLETRRFQIEDIARWFNLPVHKLREMTKSSFNNIAEEQVSFVADSVRPWLVRLEQNYNCQLLTASERKRGYYFEHSVEGLLRGDAVTRSELYKSMFNVGAMSINEIRSLENMNAIDGGDERFVPMNMVPLSMAKELADKSVESKKMPGDPTDSDNLMKYMNNVAFKVVNREGIMLFRVNDIDDLNRFYDRFHHYVYEQLEPFWDYTSKDRLTELATEYAASSREIFSNFIGKDEEEIDGFVSTRAQEVAVLFYSKILGDENETEI